MRVAFDGSVVRAPYSGVHISVLAEMEALAHVLGEEVRQCLFYCRDKDVQARIRSLGGECGPLSEATRRVAHRILWQQVSLPRRLRQDGIEVLHGLAYTAPLRCPVPYVLNIHDIIALERPELCALGNRWHMRWLLPRGIRRAGGLIVSTCYVADRLRNMFPSVADRVTVARLGVKAERFATPQDRPPLPGLSAARPYVLYLGNIEPKKDVGTLLNAYALAACSGSVDLVVAGRAAWKSGPIMRRLRHWSGPGRICRPGRIPDADLPGLLQHAVALVMPSIEEGFGMPVLEAMAAGLPVIHSDHPALVEAAGGTGVSFPMGDAAALARCLDRLVEDRVWAAELAAAGREWAKEQTWKRWAETAVDVLRQVGRTEKANH